MPEPNATVITRRTVHRGRVFSVDSDDVGLPNGRQARLDVVRHARSVVLMPLPAPDRVVLVRQYRYAVDRWIWELPAGHVEPGEHPDDTARRECREETGFQPGALALVGKFLPTPGYCDEEMWFYRLTGLTPDASASQDADEVLESHVLTLAAARQAVAADAVVDMKTALGLTLV